MAPQVVNGISEDNEVLYMGKDKTVPDPKVLPVITTYTEPATEAQRTFQVTPGQLCIGVELFGKRLNPFEFGASWSPAMPEYCSELVELSNADPGLLLHPSGAIVGRPMLISSRLLICACRPWQATFQVVTTSTPRTR